MFPRGGGATDNQTSNCKHKVHIRSTQFSFTVFVSTLRLLASCSVPPELCRFKQTMHLSDSSSSQSSCFLHHGLLISRQ